MDGSWESGKEITDAGVAFFPKTRTPVIEGYNTLKYSIFKTRQNQLQLPKGSPLPVAGAASGGLAFPP